MPLIRVDIIEGRSPEEIKALLRQDRAARRSLTALPRTEGEHG